MFCSKEHNTLGHILGIDYLSLTYGTVYRYNAGTDTWFLFMLSSGGRYETGITTLHHSST